MRWPVGGARARQGSSATGPAIFKTLDQAGTDTSSMRCRAIRAQCLSSSGTEIWLTTWPSAKFSIAQQRCGASIRNMVEHWHTVDAPHRCWAMENLAEGHV